MQALLEALSALMQDGGSTSDIVSMSLVVEDAFREESNAFEADLKRYDAACELFGSASIDSDGVWIEDENERSMLDCA